MNNNESKPERIPDSFGTVLLLVLILIAITHQTIVYLSDFIEISLLFNVLLMIIPMLLGAVLCVRTSTKIAGVQRSTTLLIGASLFTSVISVLLWIVTPTQTSPLMWITNALSLVGAPLQFAALIVLSKPILRTAVISRIALDALILGVAVGVYAWYFVISSVLQVSVVHDVSTVMFLIRPIFDFSLLGLIGLIGIRWRGQGFNRETSFYALAVLCMLVGDLGFATHNLAGLGLSHFAINTGWSWSALLFVTAVQLGHSNNNWFKLANSRVWHLRFQRPNLILASWIDTYGSVLTAVLPFGLVVFAFFDSELTRTGVQAGTALLTILVVLRQTLMLADNQRLNHELKLLSVDLEDRVFDRTRELKHREWQLKRGQQLERDRAEVLEMIARDESLDQISTRLTEITNKRHKNGSDASMLTQMHDQLTSIALGRRKLNEQLARSTSFDPLTGLPNRSLLSRQLEAALYYAELKGFMVAVLFIDLTRFKQINDSLGHSVGDKLLQLVTKRFQACIQSSDMLARMGSDEFVVVRADAKSIDETTALAQKLVTSLETALHVDELELFVSASIGLSFYPQDALDASTLQKHADAAMYRAKVHGAGSIRRFSKGMSAAAREKLEIENELRRALERISAGTQEEHGELELFYQPQVDLRFDTLIGFEALARWNHPTLGPISPMRFIPIAEESGLVVPFGNWVLREACRQNAAWQRAGLRPVRVAVNISTLQFERPEMVQTVTSALREAGLEARYLELELLESLLVQRVDESARRMEQLQQLGVELAIDDFGTGYSSLRYLQRFPIDTLKIDRSFTQGMTNVSSQYPNKRSTLPLIQTIMALAEGLSLNVVVEGVETEQQAAALTELGCQTIQGHLYSRAVNANTAGALLQTDKLNRLSILERAQFVDPTKLKRSQIAMDS